MEQEQNGSQLSPSVSSTTQQSSENIVAVFVARFDVHRGNVIEWQYPADMNLDGVEYQAICSGLHSISEDTIYFKKGSNFGISAFENKAVNENTEERGARMMAVGCLVTPTPETGSCGQLWHHIDFLRSEVKILIEQHEITSTTYDNLIEYYNNNSQKEPQSNDGLPSISTESLDVPNMTKFASLSSIDTSKLHHQASADLSQFSPSISSLAHTLTNDETAQQSVNHQLYNVIRHPAGTDAKNMEYLQVEDSHPAHAFPDFVRILGPNIFLLWKAAILKKRILILTSTPVEKACQFVYNTCLLATLPRSHELTLTLEGKSKLQPLFCVGINDIDEMETIEGGYVACTPDKIFQQKPHLFDILVTLPDQSDDESSQGFILEGIGSSYSLPQLSHSPHLRIESVDGGQLKVMRYTQANFLRYRILRIMIKSRMNRLNRRLLETTTFTDLFSEPDDGYDTKLADLLDRNSSSDTLGDTLGKFLLGGWFWWYGRDEERPARFRSWQQAFVGNRIKRRKQDRLTREERTRLLFGGDELQDDEEDAPLITESNIMATLAGNSQTIIRVESDTVDVEDNKHWLEIELIRFFHVLSLQVLLHLQTKLKDHQDEDDVYSSS
ncbi:hypothetical protein K450DRAFT_248079 [Umbelopsis ramanniana AG]|uniref:UDENN domain-containing protein n=1 Tax=Umbelopsis ramanniana AG TaxID=1314678 RepID=A0AAD5HBR0_UMBRA|nr:uncharacterized protein K450DRAFT_248079 [Umbelopsis ramanniana AG]KAI8578282.1 hypothetical protein K450DRAFT_248079 [Umbelopsis ramanniana AG]